MNSGIRPKFTRSSGRNTGERVAKIVSLLSVSDRCSEAHAAAIFTLVDELFDSGKGTTANEQHVGGIDLDELLMRVLAAALWRNSSCRAFEDLQQCLLNSLTRYVTGDRRVFALACDLVDLVDVDDAGFGLLDVVISGLQKLEKDIFDVLADVASFGQCRCISDRKRNVQHAGERLGEQRLAAAGRADEQNVRLGQLYLVVEIVAELHTSIVVVDRYGEDLLRVFLTDDVGVQELVDLGWCWEFAEVDVTCLCEFFFDDLVAKIDALIANVNARTSDELLDLFLRLTAERALKQLSTFTKFGHVLVSLILRIQVIRSSSRRP